MCNKMNYYYYYFSTIIELNDAVDYLTCRQIMTHGCSKTLFVASVSSFKFVVGSIRQVILLLECCVISIYGCEIQNTLKLRYALF